MKQNHMVIKFITLRSNDQINNLYSTVIIGIEQVLAQYYVLLSPGYLSTNIIELLFAFVDAVFVAPRSEELGIATY